MPHLETLIIVGSSMEPVIRKNETVFLETGCQEVNPGDIIAYLTECRTKIVTHRLVRKQKVGKSVYFLQCPEKGHPAGVVPGDRYLGKVWLSANKAAPPRQQWRPITQSEREQANLELAKYLLRLPLKKAYRRLRDRMWRLR